MGRGRIEVIPWAPSSNRLRKHGARHCEGEESGGPGPGVAEVKLEDSLARKGFECNAKNLDPVAVRISVFQMRKQAHRSQGLGFSHTPG